MFAPLLLFLLSAGSRAGRDGRTRQPQGSACPRSLSCLEARKAGGPPSRGLGRALPCHLLLPPARSSCGHTEMAPCLPPALPCPGAGGSESSARPLCPSFSGGQMAVCWWLCGPPCAVRSSTFLRLSWRKLKSVWIGHSHVLQGCMVSAR